MCSSEVKMTQTCDKATRDIISSILSFVRAYKAFSALSGHLLLLAVLKVLAHVPIDPPFVAQVHEQRRVTCPPPVRGRNVT